MGYVANYGVADKAYGILLFFATTRNGIRMSESRPMQLQDAVAVVTGAGRAIGREIALRLAAEGARVVLAARSLEAMQQVAEQIRDQGGQALLVPMDLTDPATIDAAASRALEEFGRVDVLVNNSGVGGPSRPMWEIEPMEWEETFRVNVTGTYLCCRAFLPTMIEQGSGSILVIGSMTGKRALVNRTPYAASKMALVGMVRTLAAELGPYGLRANVISPGGVEGERLDWVIEQQAAAKSITVEQARAAFTDPSPLRRLITTRDVANAVVFLASDAASAITGEDLNVSAGMVMY